MAHFSCRRPQVVVGDNLGAITGQLGCRQPAKGVDAGHLTEIISVKETKVISWQIEKTLRKIYEEKLLSDTNRSPEVSSIIDRRQAGFSHYMNVFVDKRTRELLDKSANQLNYNIEYSCVRDMADLKAILKLSPS